MLCLIVYLSWANASQVDLQRAWILSASACFIINGYPLTLARRYSIPIIWPFVSVAMSWLGLVLLVSGIIGLLLALVWMPFSGLVWILSFAVWHRRNLPS